jgi:hypothetical protein
MEESIAAHVFDSFHGRPIFFVTASILGGLPNVCTYNLGSFFAVGECRCPTDTRCCAGNLSR